MKTPLLGRLSMGGWLAFCLSGTLLLVHHPMLLSRLARIHADPGDMRFNNYCLEHSYLWLTGADGHGRFWDPPFFHPQRNVAAYSDLLLGVAPFYWSWRAVGVAPDTALQLWLFAVTAGTFLAAFLFLRRIIRVRMLPASLASVFFASANSLLAQLCHPQLLWQVYVIGTLAGVFMMFDTLPEQNGEAAKPRRWLPAVLFFGCMTLQFYTAFYLAFFTALVLGAAALCALAIREDRRWFLECCRTNLLPITVVGLVAAIVLTPGVIHYFAAAQELGPRGWSNVAGSAPRIQSWINMGASNWLYGGSACMEIFRQLPAEHEQRLGIGLATPLACVAGLILRRRQRGLRLLMITTVLLMLLVTQYDFLGLPSAWKFVYFCIPGGKVIRCISRIGIMLIIPATIGLAILIDHLLDKKRILFHCAGFAVAAVCFLEQFSLPPSYNKHALREDVANIAREIRPDCRMFFFSESGTNAPPSCITHLSAMWAGLAAGKPTINGYSGNVPPQWTFDRVPTDTTGTQQEPARALRAWAEKFGLDMRDIQWIAWHDGTLSTKQR